MSRYLKSWKFETTFDGDKVVAYLKPLAQADLLRLGDRKTPDGSLAARDALPIFSEVIPQYVERIEGLTDAAGAAIETDQVVRDAYFMPLLMQIGVELVRKATPANPTMPGGQPAPTSPGLQ